MIETGREKALTTWRKLMEEPEIRMDAEEQYEELLKLADDFKQDGVINSGDWRELVEEATAFYAHSIEGLEGGT
ncbi:hypothetical protein [Pseudomonas umsongensis]|uniref:hypothetical protein n=1 Tax=Pseudomonas umsongensis TaxID=198618 RepID=UPI003ECD6F14